MRVLVAYETAHGSTKETAETIGEVLSGLGATVNVARCREITDVTGHDAFVVGAPIHASNWLKPAREFVRRYEETLASCPTAYFHASGAGGDERGKKRIAATMDQRLREYAPSVEPVAIGVFGGVIQYDGYSPALRLILKPVLRVILHSREDLRDWEDIRRWAGEVHRAFVVACV